MRFASITAAAAVALGCSAGANAAVNATQDFESGAGGWDGPQGFGGSTFVDPTNGVGGSAGLRTQFQDFGVYFENSTDSRFLGDYTAHSQITISVDLKVNQIGEFLPVNRPFMLELRDYDTATIEAYASVYYLFDWVDQDRYSDFVTLSVTIDNPLSTTLPAGWGGFGDFNFDTFESILPPGVTFADVLSGVDEIAFSTLLPDFGFTGEFFDMTIDNVRIAVPGPGTASLFAVAGAGMLRRRRR